MEHQNSKKLDFLNISVIFLFFFIFTVFFPIRYIFFSNFSLITGVYSDFTSFALYLSDIFLILSTVFLLLVEAKTFWQTITKLKWLILWVLAVFICDFSLRNLETVYYFARFLELFVAYGTVATILQKKDIKVPFLSFFVTLSSFQSLIALMQFHLQHPIGLFRLGEQQVYPAKWGIAKIVVDGIAYIRGYGTFFHPNPLAAFLLTGVFLNIYLLFLARRARHQALLSITLLINLFGLAVTFSRAAYLALAISLVIFFGYLLIKKIDPRKTWKIIGLVLIGLIIAAIGLKTFLLTRTTISDEASLGRVTYAKIGLQMIKANPLFGVGLGESVPLMHKYAQMKLWPWQVQPIHNYFLLAAAELGIPGALILIWIFLSHFWKLVFSIKYKVLSNTSLTTYYLPLTTILCSFFVLMLFDHYFYTLQQTQMLLWLILGLIAAEIQTKNELNSKI